MSLSFEIREKANAQNPAQNPFGASLAALLWTVSEIKSQLHLNEVSLPQLGNVEILGPKATRQTDSDNRIAQTVSERESALFGEKAGFAFSHFKDLYGTNSSVPKQLSFVASKTAYERKEKVHSDQQPASTNNTNSNGNEASGDKGKKKSTGESIIGAAPPPPPPDDDKQKQIDHDFDPIYGTGENFANTHRHESVRKKTDEEIVNEFKPDERKIVRWLLAHGHKVEKNQEEGKKGAGKQFDALVDGKPTEFKKISNLAPQNENEEGISKTISTEAVRSRKAIDINVIIDVTEQKGATEEIARRAINRSYGADNKYGAKIKSITVIGKDFEVVEPRR